MRFGICTSIDKLPVLEELGYDYLEANASAIEKMTEDEFETALKTINSCNIGVESMAVLFPGEIFFYSTPMGTIEEHLNRTFSRASKLGIKVSVFGSGRCRKKPDDIEFSKAYSQLKKILIRTGEIAQEYGIQIAIEPLNHGETNMINSVNEAAIMAYEAGLANVGPLADSYHMFVEKENMESIRTAGALTHVHTALLKGRAYPVHETESLCSFFEALNDIDYSGRVSIEGSTDNFKEDAVNSLVVLKSLSK